MSTQHWISNARATLLLLASLRLNRIASFYELFTVFMHFLFGRRNEVVRRKNECVVCVLALRHHFPFRRRTSCNSKTICQHVKLFIWFTSFRYEEHEEESVLFELQEEKKKMKEKKLNWNGYKSFCSTVTRARSMAMKSILFCVVVAILRNCSVGTWSKESCLLNSKRLCELWHWKNAVEWQNCDQINVWMWLDAMRNCIRWNHAVRAKMVSGGLSIGIDWNVREQFEQASNLYIRW